MRRLLRRTIEPRNTKILTDQEVAGEIAELVSDLTDPTEKH